MIEIQSNGSKWMGEEPDDMETLLRVMSEHALCPRRTFYGPAHPHWPNATQFSGNFYELSHVFNIVTDEPETIELLINAITANKHTEAYQRAERELIACGQMKRMPDGSLEYNGSAWLAKAGK